MAPEDGQHRSSRGLYLPRTSNDEKMTTPMEEHSVDSSMSDSVKLGILIHRMGTLESGLGMIGEKIDNMGSLYPTTIHLDLIVSPLKDRIKDLEENEKDKERERVKQSAQFKLAVTMALCSPIFSVFITLVLDTRK